MLRLSKLRAMAIAVMATSGGGYSIVPAVGIPRDSRRQDPSNSFLQVALLGFLPGCYVELCSMSAMTFLCGAAGFDTTGCAPRVP